MKARLGRYRYLTLDGFRLRWWEGGEGEELLFLHGAGLPVDTFVEIREALALHFHVIAPDLPGWGKSDLPHAHWVYADFASLFEKLLRARGISVTCLVGYSLGGGIALSLAPRLPTLTRLVLLSPGVDRSPLTRSALLGLVAGGPIQGLAQAARADRLALFTAGSVGLRRQFRPPPVRAVQDPPRDGALPRGLAATLTLAVPTLSSRWTRTGSSAPTGCGGCPKGSPARGWRWPAASTCR